MGKQRNIIELTDEQLKDAENGSEVQTENDFLAKTKTQPKGDLGKLLNSDSSSLQGAFRGNTETEFIDTKQYSEYLYPDKKDAFAFPFQTDYNKSRAINQSNWEQAGNAFVSTLINTPLEFIGMLGNTLDLEDYANSDKEVGNWLNTWAQDLKADVNEGLPIYRENEGKALDVGDFAWWMENGAALTQSALAFVALGYTTGGATLGALKGAGKGLEFLNFLSKGKRATDTVKKGTQVAAGLANTLMLNQAEGVSVATQVYATAYDEALQELQAKGLTGDELEEEAKSIASRKASSALNFNRANILLNLTSSFAFLKAPTLTRQLLTNPSLKNSAKKTVLESLQEAGEETVNLLAEKQALDDNYSLDKAKDDVFSKEGAEAALLGAVGGAAQTTLTNAGRELKLQRDSEGNRTSANTQQRTRYAEQQETLERWNALSEEDKASDVSDIFFKVEEQKQFDRELTEAIKNNNTAKIEELKNKVLTNQAYDAFSTGTTEQFLSTFEGIKGLTLEQAKEKGLEENYIEQAELAIQKIKKLEKAFTDSSTYLDSYSVYNTKARKTAIKDTIKDLEEARTELSDTLNEDLADLAIDVIDFELDEKGKISKSLDKETRDLVNNLTSYKNINKVNETINSYKAALKDAVKEESRLTSDEYQKELLAKIKAEKAKDKAKATAEETAKEQAEKQTKKTTTKKKHKQAVTKAKEEAPTTKPEVPTPPTPKPPTTAEGVFNFTGGLTAEEQADLQAIQDKDNAFISSDKSTGIKIKGITAQIKKVQELMPDHLKAGMLIQYNKVLEELKAELATEQSQQEANDVAVENAKQAIRDLADDIDENLNPSEEPSKNDKVMQRVSKVLQTLDMIENGGVDVSTFPPVAKFAQATLGKEKLLRIFQTLQDLYNLTNRGERSNHTYEDIFLTVEEKEDVITNETDNITNTYFKDLYNLSDLAYEGAVVTNVKALLENNDYKVYSKDTVTATGFRVVEGYNKVAHLDRKYKTDIKIVGNSSFNILDFEVSKSDLNNELNSKASTEVLDYSQIKEGSEITFKVLDSVEYDDGTIVYKDGTIEKDGLKEKGDPIEIAPIGLVYNGQLLKGAYLHTVEWINELNIAEADEVEAQKSYLRLIRETVLNSETPITTTVIKRGDGFPMFDAEGKRSTVKENLPNVKLAVGKDMVFYTGSNSIAELDQVAESGYTYAIFPVKEGKEVALPIQPIQLKEQSQYIDSIIHAVKLFIKNDINDKRTIALSTKAGLDITSIEGLKKYFNYFLHLNNKLPYKFNDFKSLMIDADERTSVVRIVDNNIEFGRGANLGDTLRFINRDILKNDFIKEYQENPKKAQEKREKTIQALIAKLRNVLENNTRLNIKKDLLGKSIILPIISDEDVEVVKTSYEDFVKENTTTSQYSTTLDNGKEIYTTQANLTLDMNFALGAPEVAEETEETSVAPKQATLNFGEDALNFDLNQDLTNLAPLESDGISYSLKAVEILSSDKAKQVFEKGKKNGWDLNKILTELQIPKVQKQIILDKDITDREEIITSLLAENSFVVEVNTAQQPFEDYETLENATITIPAQYYSNLTVPGGTNYTENEIATPDIIPNIKGHAQFSTDNGIGWFRSDEQGNINSKKVTASRDMYAESAGIEYDNISDSLPEEITRQYYIESKLREYDEEGNKDDVRYEGSKTRRILEVQSDLFQKGRDKKDLLTKQPSRFSKKIGDKVKVNTEDSLFTIIDTGENNEGLKVYYLKDDNGNEIEALNSELLHPTNSVQSQELSDNNQFLQLLNKKGNWVNFFIQAIVQDSVKKGYEKVLFPTGETAAKVEGHQTIANEIKEIDNTIRNADVFKQKNEVGEDVWVISTPTISIEESSKDAFIEKLRAKKQEMKTQGFEKLKPVEAFYTNRVTNILNKLYKGRIEVITDEQGNTWNEVSLEDVNTDILLAPRDITKDQQDSIKENTPNSLLIQGVSLPIQTAIINYLSYNVVKDVVKNGREELSMDYIDNFENLLINGAIPTYTEALNKSTNDIEKKNYQNTIDIVNSILDNYSQIKLLVLDKLRTFNNIKLNGKIVKQLQTLLEDGTNSEDAILEEALLWESEGVFLQDFKNKISTELKNYFSNILDVEGFTIKDNKRTPITKASPFLGLQTPLSFDYVMNEVSGILAYNSAENNYVEPNLTSMLAVLEDYVEYKPFIHNVIEELKSAPQYIRDEFVYVMSKHYTNHVYLFKNKKGKFFVNNSDNNQIVKAVQKEWYNNLINSPLIITTESRDYTVNSTVLSAVKEEISELIESIKLQEDSDKIVNKAFEILEVLGVNLPKNIVRRIHNKSISINGIPHTLLHLFGNDSGGLNVYLNTLTKIAKDKQTLDDVYPFENNTALTNFTRALVKFNPVYFANSFRDVKNKLYYAYSLNKFLVDRVKDLKNNPNLINALLKQPFSKTSTWAEQFKNNSEEFNRYFQYFTLDGLALEGDRGKKLDALSDAEYEELKVNLFFSQNQKGSKYITNLFYPTTSDKSVQYGLKVLGKKWSDYIDKRTKTPNDAAIDSLYTSLVQPEINRILNLQKNPDAYNIKAYKEGGMMFTLLPSLNDIKKIWTEDGSRLVDDIETREDLKLLIKKELKNFVVSLISNKITKWRDMGFEVVEDVPDVINNKPVTVRKRSLKFTNNSIVEEATNYVLNYLVSNVNIYQLFTTDPAFYWKSNKDKTALQQHEDLFNNLGKRLAGDAAPGNDLSINGKSKMRVAILKDIETQSMLLDYYRGLIGNEAQDYLRVNGTDAQEFTTLKEHLLMKFKKGKIDFKTFKELLRKERKNQRFDQEELEIILQPEKPVYVNNIWTDGIEHRVYIKSSSFPLFKQLTKGLEIDKLRQAMETQKVDKAVFESAIKVGGVTNPTNLLTDGKFSDKIELTMLNDGNPIPRQGLKIQQEVPFKEDQKANDGSQQRKLLTAGLRKEIGFKIEGKQGVFSGQDIQDEMDATYNKIYKMQYDALLDELGYDDYTGNIDIYKLSDLLQNEAIKREFSLYDIEALKVVNGEFSIPLWLTGVSGKIESMLNSIVDNRVRKIKVSGRSFVLGTSEGFNPLLTGIESENYIEKNKTNLIFDEEWFKESKGQLRNARVENGVFKPAEVLIPSILRDKDGNEIDVAKFSKNGFIDFTKFDKKALELFGYRIPTQNLNSMSYVKIVGFLPKNSGTLLLAPSDWTVQMGSDFDVDKLFTMMYNLKATANKVEVYRDTKGESRAGLENYLIDLHFSILSNPKKSVQSEIIRPLSFGNLLKLADEIYPYLDDLDKGISISEEYQTFKYHNARAGKLGIAILSTDSVFNAIIQAKNLYLQVKTEDGMQPFSFSLGGKRSNALSTTETNGKSTKAKVIEAFQSLAVDNENEQGLHKLNINNDTFDVIRTLALSGFEENIIIYFINQPIIRKYLELTSKAKDTTTPYTFEDANNEIDELFPITDTKVEGAEFNTKYSNPSLKALRSAIIDGVYDNNQQRYLLNLFESLSDFGVYIKNIQTTVNTDSAGLGKNLFYSFEKENNLLTLPSKQKLLNSENLIGEYLIVKPQQGNKGIAPKIGNEEVDILLSNWFHKTITPDNKIVLLDKLKDLGYITVKGFSKDAIPNVLKFIKPTTINGFASTYGLILNNKLWGEYFPYNNTALLKALSNVTRITEKRTLTLAEKAEINKNLFNNVKSFIATRTLNNLTDSSDILEERARLFVDVEGNTPNKSLANIIKDLKADGKLNTPFINRLEFIINKNGNYSTIEYNSSSAENIDERAIYASFSAMFSNTTVLGTFNGIEYTHQKLAQDLVTASILTGGVQKSRQFIKYIPISYLKTIGYYNVLKNVNFASEDDFNSDAFKNQHLQHNPHKVELSEELRELIDGKQWRFYNNATVIVEINAPEGVHLPNIFSIKGSEGYKIYFYDFNSRSYKQKDVLGTTNIEEYDMTSYYGKSIIPSNKIPLVTKTDLPVYPKDTKKFLSLVKATPPKKEVIHKPSEQNLVDFYDLNSTDTSINKIGTALEKIVSTSDNSFNAFLAQELANNLNKIQNVKLDIDTTLKAKGSYRISTDTLKLNPLEASSKADFEGTVLEEVIHAFTVKAIKENKTGEVLRLNGLRLEAVKVVKAHLGANAEEQFKAVEDKLRNRQRLTSVEANLIYPVMSTEEFVGRLFKSKKLQELLQNTPSNIKGKSVFDKFLDLIKDILNKAGISFKRGSVLDYAITDIISLIQQPPPSSFVQAEIQKKKKTVRTPETINAKFDLTDANGQPIARTSIKDAKNIAKWINNNVSNLIATQKGRFVLVENKIKQLDIFADSEGAVEARKQYRANLEEELRNLEMEQEEAKLSPEMIILDNLPKITTKSAELETGLKVGTTKDIHPQFISVEGSSVEAASEYLKENFLEYYTITQPEIRDVIIDILSSGNKANYTENLLNTSRIAEIKTELNSTLDETLDPAEETKKFTPLLKSVNNRIKTLKKNIQKAEKKGDFDKELVLKNQLEKLELTKLNAIQANTLRQVRDVGIQDMQEVEEMFNHDISVEDTLYMRKILHLWEASVDLFFNTDALKSEELLSDFSAIQADVTRFKNRLVKIENAYMEDLLKKYDNNMSVKDIFEHYKDINGVSSYLLDISRSDNALLDVIFLEVKKANIEAKDEAAKLLSNLEKLSTKTKTILKKLNSKEPYDIFRQRTKNGLLTGHLVKEYNSDYLKTKNQKLYNLRQDNTLSNYERVIEWSKENNEEINLHLLFPINKQTKEQVEEAKAYKEELKSRLGENSYNNFINNQKKKLDTFKSREKAYLESLYETYNVTSYKEILANPEAKKRFINWSTVNSPYVFYTHFNKQAPDFINWNSPKYVEFIPNKEEHYDANFKTIADNKDLLEFYNYFVSIDKELKDNLTMDQRSKLATEGIPYVDKVLLEAYNDKGMKAGYAPIYDALKRSVRTSEESVVDDSNIDPITGIEEKELDVKLSSDKGILLRNALRIKKADYVGATGKQPTSKMLETWKEEIIHKISQEKSYDLSKVLRVYATTVLGFKHKAKIEDMIKLSQNILKEQVEYERTSKGIINVDGVGRKLYKPETESFKNTKAQYEYFIQSFFNEGRDNEGITNKKILTSKEKVQLQEAKDALLKLQIKADAGIITPEEFESLSEDINEVIEELGGFAVWSKRGDALLKYVQLKGMGWNIMSGIANIGFGYISNRIEASGGQLYTVKQLRKAYKLSRGSMLKNITFNKVETSNAKKIRSLMEKWDILKDASKELYQTPLTVVTSKKTNWLAPYNLTQRAEYINQAPVMIALMLNTKLENGKNLWEGFNEDGSWNTEFGEEPKELITKLRIKIDQTNKMNHGNYDPDSALMIKGKLWGRALSQFRTWMFEGVAMRFEAEKDDKALGITRKGRYVSFVDYYKNVGFSDGSARLLKGLIKDLTFGKTFKNSDFNDLVDGQTFKEVDAANMRKLLSEMVMLMGIYSSYLMMSAISEGLDPEEDKLESYLVNNLINQGLRLKTDIMFYLNPNEFRNLLRDLIPATTVIKDGIGWIEAVQRASIGDDEIGSGVYAGHSRILRETAQMLPFGTQIYKNISYSIQSFDK